MVNTTGRSSINKMRAEKSSYTLHMVEQINSFISLFLSFLNHVMRIKIVPTLQAFVS